MAKPLVLHSETISTLPQESFPPPTPSSTTPSTGDVTWKTLLTSSSTPTDTFVSGIATCTSNGGFLALHRHSHAEIYYIISGTGMVQIENQEYRVKRGSVVYIPGNALHGARSLKQADERCGGGEEKGEGLKWLYVFAADNFGEVVYRFEGHEEVEVGAELKLKAKL